MSLYRRTATSPITTMPSVTFSGAATFSVQAFEYSGLSTAAVVDNEGNGTGTSLTTNATGALPITDNLVMAFFAGPSGLASVTSGYNSILTTAGPLRSFAKNVTATTTQTVTGTGSPSSAWVGLIAAFQAAPGGNPPAPDTGKLRVFSKLIGSTPYLHTINPAGAVRALGNPMFEQTNLASDYAITTTLANVGLQDAFDSAGNFKITVVAHINFSGTPGKTDVGISINGVDQAGVASTVHTTSRNTIMRVWRVIGATSGHVIQVRAVKAATGTADLKATDTTLMVEQMA